MKLVQAGLLAVSAASLFTFVGCTTSPRTTMAENRPAIMANATRHDMVTGESVLVMAHTENLVGARDVKWSISPNAPGARLAPDNGSNNTSAFFSADQPGVYVITATADAGNGRIVSSDTTVTVHGRNRNMAHD